MLFLVAIQCLESAYSIDTQDESHIAKYQVQRNLLDIFNSQISSEVSQCLEPNKSNVTFFKYKLFTWIHSISTAWIRFFNFVTTRTYSWGKRESWEVKEWRYKLEGSQVKVYCVVGYLWMENFVFEGEEGIFINMAVVILAISE